MSSQLLPRSENNGHSFPSTSTLPKIVSRTSSNDRPKASFGHRQLTAHLWFFAIRRGNTYQPRATPWVCGSERTLALKGRNKLRIASWSNRLFCPFRATTPFFPLTPGVAWGCHVKPLRGKDKHSLKLRSVHVHEHVY